MNKIKKLLLAVSSFFIWLTGNVFANPLWNDSLSAPQIKYGIPREEPTNVFFNILKIIAIPFILILGIIIFVIHKKRKNKDNTNLNEK